MASIVVIKLSALGDLVQADGAMRDIRENHPDEQVTVMTTPPYRHYMRRCPWVDEVFIDPRASRFNIVEMIRLRKRLQRLPLSKVYDLQQVGRTRFYHRWLFPRCWWMGDAPGCSAYLKRDEASVCAAEHFASHLQKAGLNVVHSLRGNVSWMAEDVAPLLAKERIEKGYVLLIPGTSSAYDNKRWPHFHSLAEKLMRAGKEVVMVPGPAELALCRSIPGKVLVPENGFYDVFMLAGIARFASCVIGNDTGPTHIAAHMGVPGIALFGKHTPSYTTGIQYTRFAVMERSNLAGLSVEDVWQQLGPLLSVQ